MQLLCRWSEYATSLAVALSSASDSTGSRTAFFSEISSVGLFTSLHKGQSSHNAVHRTGRNFLLLRYLLEAREPVLRLCLTERGVGRCRENVSTRCIILYRYIILPLHDTCTYSTYCRNPTDMTNLVSPAILRNLQRGSTTWRQGSGFSLLSLS